MQGEQAMNRADDRDEVEGFDNLQTEAEVAEFEAWLDSFDIVPTEYYPEGEAEKAWRESKTL